MRGQRKTNAVPHRKAETPKQRWEKEQAAKPKQSRRDSNERMTPDHNRLAREGKPSGYWAY
jgi:hypothetical protein